MKNENGKKKKLGCLPILLVIILCFALVSIFGKSSKKAEESMSPGTTAERETPSHRERMEPEAETKEAGTTAAESEAEAEESGTTESEASETEAPETSTPETEVPSGGVTPEFKEAMDSYEAFFDEYIAFMKKYSESGNPVTMLADYTSYMARYAETMKKLDALESEAMTDADTLYYIEVNTRIQKKLLEASL